jgi:hypothetical protein
MQSKHIYFNFGVSRSLSLRKKVAATQQFLYHNDLFTGPAKLQLE